MELVGCEDVEARSHEALASLVFHKSHVVICGSFCIVNGFELNVNGE